MGLAEASNPVPRLLERGEAAHGPVGRYLQVRNSASEKGLSLLTRGRLKEAVTPSRSIVARVVAPFIGLPLSACRTMGWVIAIFVSSGGASPAFSLTA